VFVAQGKREAQGHQEDHSMQVEAKEALKAPAQAILLSTASPAAALFYDLQQ